MAAPSVGGVVLVWFPFSDLSAAKFRPGVVLANIERSDHILCRVTSNPYADPEAVYSGRKWATDSGPTWASIPA